MDELRYDVESSEFKCSALCFLFSLLFSGIDLFIFNEHTVKFTHSLLVTSFLSCFLGVGFFVWFYTGYDSMIEPGRPMGEICKPKLNKKLIFVSIASALTGSVLILLMRLAWRLYF